MRQYQKRRRLHMLIAILMSLNIVSVGYATWAITGPSTSEAGGNFQSYAVAYYTIAIDPSFQAYHNKDGAAFFIPNGDLASFKDPMDPTATETDAPRNQATLTLTYTAASTKTAEITTTVMFSPDEELSKLFFQTAAIDPNTKITLNGTPIAEYSCSNGVLSFTFTPQDKDVVVIHFNTANKGEFDADLCDGESRGFVVRTMVQDTN